MSDDLSGDMLEPSWPNLVYSYFYLKFDATIEKEIWKPSPEKKTRFFLINMRLTEKNFKHVQET